jgi:deazaflavin-dependent oxidoreductase (nitroreductase family)
MNAIPDNTANASTGPESTGPESTARYIKPSTSDDVFNATVARLTKLGISVWGSRILYVRGRSTGELRSTPVNLLTVDGTRYLVAPRGVTQWVRNVRVANGQAQLRVGRRTEDVRMIELADEAKPALLRAYLKRWWFEVGVFFDGVNAKAPESQLRQIAPGYPVFRVEPRR